MHINARISNSRGDANKGLAALVFWDSNLFNENARCCFEAIFLRARQIYNMPKAPPETTSTQISISYNLFMIHICHTVLFERQRSPSAHLVRRRGATPCSVSYLFRIQWLIVHANAPRTAPIIIQYPIITLKLSSGSCRSASMSPSLLGIQSSGLQRADSIPLMGSLMRLSRGIATSRAITIPPNRRTVAAPTPIYFRNNFIISVTERQRSG